MNLFSTLTAELQPKFKQILLDFQVDPGFAQFSSWSRIRSGPRAIRAEPGPSKGPGPLNRPEPRRIPQPATVFPFLSAPSSLGSPTARTARIGGGDGVR